jgi:hypothetical protein
MFFNFCTSAIAAGKEAVRKREWDGETRVVKEEEEVIETDGPETV